MKAFWRWLAQANARKVLMSAIVVFLLVGGYWVWRELSIHSTGVLAIPGRGNDKGSGPAGIGLLDYVDEQLCLSSTGTLGNPFFYVAQRPPPKAEPPKVEPPKAEPPKVTPPPPKPQPKYVSVVYRGMMVRPDSQVMALVEDQGAKRTGFRKTGESLHGARIESVDAKEMKLTLKDGSTLSLTLGEPKLIPEIDGGK